MLIVGVDVETTGLDKDNDQIVEIGIVLFDTSIKRVLSSFGKIYKVDVWGIEAEECHHISRETSEIMPPLSQSPDPWDVVSGDLAKYVVAHNAAHDHAFVTKVWPSFLKKPWLCTQNDLIHKDKIGRVASHRLAHLCVDYGISIGSWHQALADAEACARLASEHDLDVAYKRKIEPRYRLIAYGCWIPDIGTLVKEAPSVIKDGARYKWNTDDAPKAWSKDGLTVNDLKEDIAYFKEITDGKWKFDGIELPPKPY